jgi:hypothetical protein
MPRHSKDDPETRTNSKFGLRLPTIERIQPIKKGIFAKRQPHGQSTQDNIAEMERNQLCHIIPKRSNMCVYVYVCT